MKSDWKEMLEAGWQYLSLNDNNKDFCHLSIFLKFSSFIQKACLTFTYWEAFTVASLIPLLFPILRLIDGPLSPFCPYFVNDCTCTMASLTPYCTSLFHVDLSCYLAVSLLEQGLSGSSVCLLDLASPQFIVGS